MRKFEAFFGSTVFNFLNSLNQFKILKHLKQSSLVFSAKNNRHLGQMCREVFTKPNLILELSDICKFSNFFESFDKRWTQGTWKSSAISESFLKIPKYSLSELKTSSNCFNSFEPSSSESRTDLFTVFLSLSKFSNFPAKTSSIQASVDGISVGTSWRDGWWWAISATRMGVMGAKIDLERGLQNWNYSLMLHTN